MTLAVGARCSQLRMHTLVAAAEHFKHASPSTAAACASSAMRTVRFGLGRGLRVECGNHKHLLLGIYEIELDRWLRRLCRPGYTTFDVGGQLGYDALVFAKRTGGRVVTFECEAVWCRSIRHALVANPALCDLIDLVEAEVADRHDADAGTVTLDAHSGKTGWDPDIVKLDVEGAELKVLIGAAQMVQRRHPHLIVEVHSAELERECGTWLVERGYRPRVVSQRRFLPDYRPTGHNRWLVAVGTW